MIRTKNKILAEANDPNTVVMPDNIPANKFIVGTGSYFSQTSANNTVEHPSIKVLTQGKRQLIYENRDHMIQTFNYNYSNRLIGADANGQLALFERNALPDTPPENRELVTEIYGATQPNGIMVDTSITLTGKHWYEIEISGCGGGGGSGTALATNTDLIDGKEGGPGGYYKGTFAVMTDVVCRVQIGCPGGGAKGYVVDNTSNTATITQIPSGGDGGYTPILYEDSAANDGENDVLTHRSSIGGLGINGGANGGTVIGWKWRTAGDLYVGAGAGGGANGEYGGAGGNSGPFNVADSTLSTTAINGYIGGAGGAGGGFGQGGNGGSGAATENPEGQGGISYGAGGGGGCSNLNSTQLTSSGCGGGGGGASRFLCPTTISGELEILCGGGGGGSGACDISAQHTDGRHRGSAGRNNKNTAVGGGATGGLGGSGVSVDMKVAKNTSGTTGSRGWIKIWRCL